MSDLSKGHGKDSRSTSLADHCVWGDRACIRPDRDRIHSSRFSVLGEMASRIGGIGVPWQASRCDWSNWKIAAY
jgi:hypothetical protein